MIGKSDCVTTRGFDSTEILDREILTMNMSFDYYFCLRFGFLQQGNANEDNLDPGKKGTTINVLCCYCNKRSNISFKCAEPDCRQRIGKSGNGYLQIQYGFTKNE